MTVTEPNLEVESGLDNAVNGSVGGTVVSEKWTAISNIKIFVWRHDVRTKRYILTSLI